MSQKIVNVLGYAKANNQFVVKAQSFDVRIGKNENFPELEGPSPIEYILAGYAGCVNAVGIIVARELNIDLQSLEVEISGVINTDKYLGIETNERAGFNKIEVIIKPNADISFDKLQNWLHIVESRCPVYDNLINPTPIQVSLINEYEAVESL